MSVGEPTLSGRRPSSVAAPADGRRPKTRRRPSLLRGSTLQRKRLLYALPAMVFLVAFFVYPLYLMVDLSLHQVSLGSVRRPGNPSVGLDNYRAVLKDPNFRSAVPRTLVFVVTTVVAQLAIGLAVAALLVERFPGLRIARSLIFFVWLLPPVVSGSIWRFLLNGTEDGVINRVLQWLGHSGEPVGFLTDGTLGMAAITVVNTWAGVPFVAIVLVAALQGVPATLYEAARVDGAGATQRFRDITLPSIAPTLATLAVLLTIYAFKTFDYILVLTRGGPGKDTSTVPFLAYITSFSEYDFGVGAAIGVLSVLGSLLLASPYLLQIRKERRP